MRSNLPVRHTVCAAVSWRCPVQSLQQRLLKNRESINHSIICFWYLHDYRHLTVNRGGVRIKSKRLYTFPLKSLVFSYWYKRNLFIFPCTLFSFLVPKMMRLPPPWFTMGMEILYGIVSTECSTLYQSQKVQFWSHQTRDHILPIFPESSRGISYPYLFFK